MPNIRDILNKIKWTKDLQNIEILYLHRGTVNNTKSIAGTDIIDIGRSFLETATATIPYHRITKILYNGKTVFDRNELGHKDKQL
jgi:uncharacterized protein (UPF0248 family)